MNFCLALALTATLAAGACKPVVVKDAPDAAAGFRDCATKPIPFCDAGPTGSVGCVADPSAKSRVVRELPPGETYPVGCVANLIVPIIDGDCRVAATCRCGEVDGGVGWSCFP